MNPEPLRLTEDEQELLKLAKEAEDFIILPYWRNIEIFLNAFVQEALDDVRGNQSVDGMVALHKQRVWRERESLRDSLIAFVKGPLKDKQDLIDQIKELGKDIRSNAREYTNTND